MTSGRNGARRACLTGRPRGPVAGTTRRGLGVALLVAAGAGGAAGGCASEGVSARACEGATAWEDVPRHLQLLAVDTGDASAGSARAVSPTRLALVGQLADTGAVVYAPLGCGPLEREEIAGAGAHPRAAVDASGRPWVAFEDGAGGVSLAVRDAGRWTVSALAPAPAATPVLARASDGRLVAAWRVPPPPSGGSSSVAVAFLDPASAATAGPPRAFTVASGDVPADPLSRVVGRGRGLGVGLTLRASDGWTVAFEDAEAGQLQVARGTLGAGASAWVAAAGRGPALVDAGGGALALLYQAPGGLGVRYSLLPAAAPSSGTPLGSESVDDGLTDALPSEAARLRRAGAFLGGAVDASGAVRAVYMDETSADLVVATRGADGGWTRVPRLRDGATGFDAQLVSDGQQLWAAARTLRVTGGRAVGTLHLLPVARAR